MRFDGKVAIVTGGASGIGLASVHKLASEGLAIAYLVDADAAALELARQSLADASTEVVVKAIDVRDPKMADQTVGDIIAHHGRLDILMTAAGISRGKTLIETDDETWAEVFSVNVTGTFVWMRAALRAMVAARSGNIVTVASQLAYAGGTNNAAYIASKGAIVSLTKTTAVEVAQQGVRVNSVAPGATDTPLLRRSMARADDEARARSRSQGRHAMNRFGEAEEIAAAVAYLASDEASFTTGVVLPVDGGWLAA